MELVLLGVLVERSQSVANRKGSVNIVYLHLNEGPYARWAKDCEARGGFWIRVEDAKARHEHDAEDEAEESEASNFEEYLCERRTKSRPSDSDDELLRILEQDRHHKLAQLPESHELDADLAEFLEGLDEGLGGQAIGNA